jgi:hypothetical protein
MIVILCREIEARMFHASQIFLWFLFLLANNTQAPSSYLLLFPSIPSLSELFSHFIF